MASGFVLKAGSRSSDANPESGVLGAIVYWTGMDSLNLKNGCSHVKLEGESEEELSKAVDTATEQAAFVQGLGAIATLVVYQLCRMT